MRRFLALARCGDGAKDRSVTVSPPLPAFGLTSEPPPPPWVFPSLARCGAFVTPSSCLFGCGCGTRSCCCCTGEGGGVGQVSVVERTQDRHSGFLRCQIHQHNNHLLGCGIQLNPLVCHAPNPKAAPKQCQAISRSFRVPNAGFFGSRSAPNACHHVLAWLSLRSQAIFPSEFPSLLPQKYPHDNFVII